MADGWWRSTRAGRTQLKRTRTSAEFDVVISQTRASEELAAERTRRAAWQRTVENAASFGDPLGRNTWVGCTTST
jgi:hypothetical protein